MGLSEKDQDPSVERQKSQPEWNVSVPDVEFESDKGGEGDSWKGQESQRENDVKVEKPVEEVKRPGRGSVQVRPVTGKDVVQNDVHRGKYQATVIERVDQDYWNLKYSADYEKT